MITQADVVLALGKRIGQFGTLPQYGMDYWPEDAKIIQVDADHKVLGLVKKISVGVCGDVKAFSKAIDRKSTRLNSSHVAISYAVFCLKKKIRDNNNTLEAHM